MFIDQRACDELWRAYLAELPEQRSPHAPHKFKKLERRCRKRREPFVLRLRNAEHGADDAQGLATTRVTRTGAVPHLEGNIMTPTITAFERSPDRGQGLARDMRVRWALEEVGQAYDVRLVSFAQMKEPAHRALHPFGQIPTYEQGDLTLFESGSIVLHLAEQHPGLLPKDAHGRARAITWMFAALSTVEPPILELMIAKIIENDKPWSAQRLPLIEERIRKTLAQLSQRLGDAEWLDGTFSAGDLMMASVLLRLKSSGIPNEYPNLAAYVARAEARPAYKRAFEAQLAVFKASAS